MKIEASALCRAFSVWLGVCLVGYAFMGKGFAYLGWRPVYIGEVTLFFGLAVAVYSGRYRRWAREPFLWSLGVLGVWVAFRTLPFLGSYGVDAVRDAMIWGYGLFAAVVVAVVEPDESQLRPLARAYDLAAKAFVILAPVIWLVFMRYRSLIPVLPGSAVELIRPKAGDIGVHLAAIAVFFMLGGTRKWRLLWYGLWAVGGFLVMSYSRAAILTIVLPVLLVLLVQRERRWAAQFLVTAFAVMLALGVADARIQLDRRDASVTQIVQNAVSIFTPSEAPTLQNTKEWRLAWWEKIAGYTLLGQYFWQGKGFGVNLATDDQVPRAPSLRSPHNATMTFLARSGVPGLVLWVGTQFIWLWQILRKYLATRAQPNPKWSKVFLFLLAFWLASLINSSFDVYLEGPMGAVWFWVVCGAGLVAARAHSLSSREA